MKACPVARRDERSQNPAPLELKVDVLATHSSCRLILRISIILLGSHVHLELCLAALLDLHDAGGITTPVTVIRRRPDGHQGVVEHVLVTFLYELMCSCDQGDAVDMVELRVMKRSQLVGVC